MKFFPGFSFNNLENHFCRQEKPLCRLQRHLPFTKGEIIGWSLGGVKAVHYALKNPDKVKKIFLICCNYKFDQQLLAPFEKNLKINTKKTIDNFVFEIAKSCGTNYKDIYKFLQSTKPCTEYEKLKPDLELLKTYNLHNLIPQLSCEVVNIISDNDWLCPSDNFANIPNTIIMPNGGHAPFLSNLDKFNKILQCKQ